MKLFNIFLITIIALLITLLIFIYLIPKTSVAEINGHTFSLYLAKTASEQEVGLAKYKSLAQNQGMLFLFGKSDYYSFWMKDMRFPIDIIFISNDKIVDIFPNVPIATSEALPTYATSEKADKVLEINAGLSAKYNIKVGTLVKLNL